MASKRKASKTETLGANPSRKAKQRGPSKIVPVKVTIKTAVFASLGSDEETVRAAQTTLDTIAASVRDVNSLKAGVWEVLYVACAILADMLGIKPSKVIRMLAAGKRVICGGLSLHTMLPVLSVDSIVASIKQCGKGLNKLRASGAHMPSIGYRLARKCATDEVRKGGNDGDVIALRTPEAIRAALRHPAFIGEVLFDGTGAERARNYPCLNPYDPDCIKAFLAVVDFGTDAVSESGEVKIDLDLLYGTKKDKPQEPELHVATLPSLSQWLAWYAEGCNGEEPQITDTDSVKVLTLLMDQMAAQLVESQDVA